MTKSIYLTVLALWIIGAEDLLAQYATKGLDLDGNLSAWYDQALGIENSKIFEGSYYDLGNPYADENQYYKGGQWKQGMVCLDGQNYHGIDLLYNSHEDLLIIRNTALHFSLAQPTLINQQRVAHFQFQESKFVHLQDSIVPQNGVGFYEQLFDGRQIDFFIKRIKNEYIKSGKLVYKEEDRYYIFHEDRYTRYIGKKSLYSQFPEHKAALKNFSKNLNTSMRQGGEKDLGLLLDHCDKLLSKK